MSYKQYLRVSANVIKDKRKNCPHGKFDEVVHYKRCLECGQYVPYRTEEDKRRRGEIVASELTPEEEHLNVLHEH